MVREGRTTNLDYVLGTNRRSGTGVQTGYTVRGAQRNQDQRCTRRMITAVLMRRSESAPPPRFRPSPHPPPPPPPHPPPPVTSSPRSKRGCLPTASCRESTLLRVQAAERLTRQNARRNGDAAASALKGRWRQIRLIGVAQHIRQRSTRTMSLTTARRKPVEDLVGQRDDHAEHPSIHCCLQIVRTSSARNVFDGLPNSEIPGPSRTSR